MIDLVDIGVNLTNRAFGGDLDAVLERARVAGVRRQIVTGTSVAASRAAADLAAAHPGTLYCTAGVHPHDAKLCDEQTLDALRGLAKLPQVVAIGECGLDFDRDFSPRPTQRTWFARQVELAVELGKPLFLHERDAADDLLEILVPHRASLPAAVVHCFTGQRAALERYLALDLYIGITGWICDERRGLHLHELVREIPEDRLLLETDAPYLVPRTLRPKPKSGRNEPAFLTAVLDTVATCLDLDAEEVAARTTRNAERLFGLAP
ncbi:MAG: TatD family hydrolase [Planctomycetes bacterium]|nr:TatD family hydrolase [Planctomycetota bacterium]MCB9868817.1 TatD family hydrolase [Planctomycetota bacterium]